MCVVLAYGGCVVDRFVSASLSHLISGARSVWAGRVVCVFAGLLLLTGGSSWFAESDASRGVAPTAFIMTIAALKIRLVGMHFMELRHAPLALRIAFHGWIVAVWALVVGLS
ncbi:cytochrome C oxidase subunit IV family protein [Candidatus Frankia alpina]|uniref:Uncharacterized protein n=1 Tax=Candidatus Frankia alpina TaxID=2699483 RepID=A0A4S5BLA9_9ACTN|nr:hypothetical protein E7Y31_22145 [Candidatus Frankia alpina]